MDKKIKIEVSYRAAVVAAIFSFIVSILLLMNFIQLQRSNPIESEVLKSLTERLASDPQNETLIHEIRSFDLMARRAYFGSKWQIETGGILLILGAIVLVIALRNYFTLTNKIELPDEEGRSTQKNRLFAQQWVIGTGFVFIASALAVAVLSVISLKPISNLVSEQTAVSENDNNIEKVSITSTTSTTQDSAPNGNNSVVLDAANDSKLSSSDTSISVEVKATPISYPSEKEIEKQYNGFRGPFGNGVSEHTNVPTAWDGAAGSGILWKAKIPSHGFSSPVVWGEKLFVTGATSTLRTLYCYSASTGKLLWKGDADNIVGSPTVAPKTTEDTGLAAPSVTTNGIQVVAIFGTGDIIAFDMEGKRLWALNLGVPVNHYGHSSSLISFKEKVFVQFDTNSGGRLIALNISSGEIIWDVKRNSKISWASPILAKVGNAFQLVLSADPNVIGYDLETGKELWSIKCMSGEVGPSPAFGNGLVYVGNEYAKVAALDPSTSKIVWETDEYMPEVASPVVANGLCFIATSYGILVCYDAHTGSKYWEKEFAEGFYSSPVVVSGNLYACDKSGVTHIIKVDREFNEVGNPALGEGIYTTPAIANGRIFIRGKDNLYCIGR